MPRLLVRQPDGQPELHRLRYIQSELFRKRYMITLLTPLGDALKRARLERGLTQAAVAELAGVPRLKVIQTESGDERVAARYYAQVAQALGLRLELSAFRRPTLDDLQRERSA